jgi:multidrug resistance efflux pump
MAKKDDKPYGPVRYGPPSPEWVRKASKSGHQRRAEKFIQAIIDESAQKGKKLTHDQAKRELQRQQRLSQKEIMWQEHRETLTEVSPKGEAKRPPHKVKFVRTIAPPPESELERLKRENAELKAELESLKESVKSVTFENRQLRRELNK